jgi:hypothetical protein
MFMQVVCAPQLTPNPAFGGTAEEGWAALEACLASGTIGRPRSSQTPPAAAAEPALWRLFVLVQIADRSAIDSALAPLKASDDLLCSACISLLQPLPTMSCPARAS